MKHIHITENGEVIGTVYLDKDGVVKGDGTPAAHNAIHNINHGLKPEHGEKLLHAIIQKLDSATMVNARECNDPDCPHLKHHEESDIGSSTQPTEVNNPEDHWPEYGERSPGQSDHGDTEHDWR